MKIRENGIDITQLGPLAEGPSQPMWATCFTSVGNPICISSSFSSAKFFFINGNWGSDVHATNSATFSLNIFLATNYRELILYVPNICEMYLRPFKRPFTLVVILAWEINKSCCWFVLKCFCFLDSMQRKLRNV